MVNAILTGQSKLPNQAITKDAYDNLSTAEKNKEVIYQIYDDFTNSGEYTKAQVDTLLAAKANTADVVAGYAPRLDTVGFHNSIFRGKLLGTSVSNDQWNAIAAGTFEDMYIGDYWTITYNSVTIDYVICDFDYYLRCGDSSVTNHHVVVMPRGVMSGMSGITLLSGESAGYYKWNATSDAPSTHNTNGGYKFSRMRKVILPACDTMVTNIFGSAHVLYIPELLPSPASASASGVNASWAWFNESNDTNSLRKAICELCNETQVYGQKVWDTNQYEVGIDKRQLSIFVLDPTFANIRSSWWLRGVDSSAYACGVDGHGGADDAGSAFAIGLRPRFCLK